MNFRDIGIIIAKKPLKENSNIIWVFTKNYGLYTGVVRSNSKKTGSICQEGNLVDFFWQARLHEHIGTAKCELIKSYSGILITNKIKLYAFNSIISLIKTAFHEREPHNNFFPKFKAYLESLITDFDIQKYIKFELEILSETGYKLELDKCVVTQTTENLCYVSPKSGKAVSLNVGYAYADRLLPLPKFLTIQTLDLPSIEELKKGFELTTYFFNRYFFHNHRQPESRKIFIAAIMEEMNNL